MNPKIIKCFIASPGDTLEERSICEKILSEINNTIGNAFNFRVECLMWEKDSRPAFGDYSQEVISSQLGFDYELFVGILNQKFGTPTKVAGSGTEEEFYNAYDRYINKEKVEIMFYFNDEAPKKLSQINYTELEKVNSFKKTIAELGGYYWQYNGHNDFEGTLRRHLTGYFIKEYGNSSTGNTDISYVKKNEVIRKKFEERFKKALTSFDGQPIIWVDPIISPTNRISQNPEESYKGRIGIEEILNGPKSSFIKAPPQFGLTSLAHFLVKEAWEKGDLWIYLDSENLKAHNIHNAVKHELELLGLVLSDVKCIILDSWQTDDNNALKKLKNLCDAHKDIPIVVMHTMDDSKFLSESANEQEDIDREFVFLYLLGLPRTQVRKVVAEYNKAKQIAEENILLGKIISDLEVLNIHRTPLNCITLLKASEKYFDESPVNRTALLEMVLFVLFNMDGVPRYRTKPDLKDCEYILGRFCEHLIRSDFYEFSRDGFLLELNRFCSEKLIDVETDIVFDVLVSNNIIVKRNLNFVFRATYWVLYFAAKRMHNDSDFCNYIFSTKKYISFPEIIEFYTGIDRNRSDALKILSKDISQTCDTVISKVGLSDKINPLSFMKWMPTEEQIEHAQKEISDNVIKSNLPESLKDQHADKAYNQIRPYNQSIQAFFEEYSVHNLMQNIKASSRALRNSDYVDAATKREILKEILRSWEQISIVLFALTPVLASKGEARIEGANFELDGDFGDTFEERANMIIQVNPTNVVGFFKDDLISNKIAPLLYEQFNAETNPLKKHQLALLFIFSRPREWKKCIEGYIVSLSKNSFYLFDMVNNLKAKYAYDFTTEVELREIEYLLKMGLAKHTTGDKKPSLAAITKVPKYQIPKREYNEE